MPRLVARAGQPGEDDREQYHPYRVGRMLTTVLAAVGWALLCGGVLLLMPIREAQLERVPEPDCGMSGSKAPATAGSHL